MVTVVEKNIVSFDWSCCSEEVIEVINKSFEKTVGVCAHEVFNGNIDKIPYMIQALAIAYGILKHKQNLSKVEKYFKEE